MIFPARTCPLLAQSARRFRVLLDLQPFDMPPVSEYLQYLVDLTGEATGIRMMLPARTRLVENEAPERLRATIEKEAFQYILRLSTGRRTGL